MTIDTKTLARWRSLCDRITAADFSWHFALPHERQEFIATAREAVPALLDEIAVLQTELDAALDANRALREENARLRYLDDTIGPMLKNRLKPRTSSPL